ncbi:MAG TPA: hypothetical protein P5533_00035 [Candidatus Cloacimonadota bacterium]|nr:hypothetical protein [Candidatus Cloacimonadota bacterium]
MRLPPRSILSAFLFLICLNTTLLDAKIGFSNLLSLQTTGIMQDDSISVSSRLLLQPESMVKFNMDNKLEVSAELSFQSTFETDFETDPSIGLELYRLWGRLDYSGYELRAGLQQLNFGSARVLRPLQWFDRIDPQDKFQLTSGVKALLLRKYFRNNAGIWAWGLLAEDGVGTDEIDAVSDDPEVGARLELPLGKIESGFSFHYRDFRRAIFGTRFREHRLGLDLRYDGPLGVWLEACASSYQQEGIDLPASGSALSLGADYTLGIGNGVYLMQEIYWRDYVEHLHWGISSGFRLASMVTYPLGILDQLQLLWLYEKRLELQDLSLGWQRTYDYLSWELRLSLKQAGIQPVIYSIMARFSYNI